MLRDWLFSLFILEKRDDSGFKILFPFDLAILFF